MDDSTPEGVRGEAERKAYAAPEKAVGGVMFCIGLASVGVLVWASRKLMSLDRAVDVGDVAVLSVFFIFAAFCVGMGWRLFRSRSGYGSMGAESLAPGPAGEQGAPASPPKRVTLSSGCAAAGVLFLMLCVLLPADWYPVVFLFLGIALLAVSHALTPCVERLERLRKARASVRQL